MLISFLIFFALFTSIGISTYFWRKSTVEDYLLASRETPVWLVALSFGASVSSGATFIGVAGLTYFSGVAALTAGFGIMLGDHLGWHVAKSKIQELAAQKSIKTYPTLVGSFGDTKHKWVIYLVSILSVIFLGAYCSAQMVAGAKTAQVLFGWDFNIFIVVAAAILLAYCWAGGIRASIWTDGIQAIIIFSSLFILVVAGIIDLGGISGMLHAVQTIGGDYLNFWQVGALVSLIGWFFFGFGVLGQPHLMVRHMAARSASDIKKAARIYLTWRWVVIFLSILSGMIARVLIPATEGFDPELSIPALWGELLPPVLVGLLLAGLFSATMSTADSLLLSASSALTQHFIPKWRDSYMYAKLGTVIVITVSVVFALFASNSVLSLVVLAWGGMASSIAPLMSVQLLGYRPDQKTSVAMIIVGISTAFFWRYVLDLHSELMDLVPGILSGFVVFGVSRMLGGVKRSTL